MITERNLKGRVGELGALAVTMSGSPESLRRPHLPTLQYDTSTIHALKATISAFMPKPKTLGNVSENFRVGEDMFLSIIIPHLLLCGY